MELKKWNDVMETTYETFIMGNGASIAVDQCFSYDDLIKEANLTPQIKKIFHHFSTSDFEYILKILINAQYINEIIGIDKHKIIEIYNVIREALIKSIQKKHSSYLSAKVQATGLSKFNRQFKNVISLNYDLILYWSMMMGNAECKNRFNDCFNNGCFDDDTEKYRKLHSAVDSTLIFYPHGNLILGTDNNTTIKFSRDKESNGDLLNKILSQWGKEKYNPLFICEGDSERKLMFIRSNEYLSYVYYQILPKLGDNILIYGWSMGEQDEHITKQICKSAKKITISMYKDGYKNKEDLEAAMKKIESNIKKYGYENRREIEVDFFDSTQLTYDLNRLNFT